MEKLFDEKMSSDVQTMVIEPLTKFYKDSAYLVKKCTKPDHKGNFKNKLCTNFILVTAPTVF